MKNNKALIVVDMQRDFVEGGALPVPGALKMVPVIESLIDYFSKDGTNLPVFITQDWHPKNHVSFAINHPNQKVFDEIEYKPKFSDINIKQKLWPVHCVEFSFGAESVLKIINPTIGVEIRKGSNLEVDSYSAFFDNCKFLETDLNWYLRRIDEDPSKIDLYICGVATDYCVLYSVLDALKIGYNVYVIKDLCRGISKDGGLSTFSEMERKGAKLITSGEIEL